MSTARRENFGSLLEPGLRKIFYETYDQIPSMIAELYNVQTTSNPFEKDQSIGTMGDFPKFEGTVEYDRPYEGFSKIYEFPEFAKGFRIERKLYDDDICMSIAPCGLAISAQRETDGQLCLNANSDRVGGGGVALCSTQHPSKVHRHWWC